jgi:hypothetical protein
MLQKIVFLILPLLAWGQAPLLQTAPPEVDQALRARVTEFFQYHTDGSVNFRKAYEIVAEDTKDEYFAKGKDVYKSFKVDSIKYSDNFTKAEVQVVVERIWEFRMQKNAQTVPLATTWKIENGKWVWYHDLNTPLMTPMGPSALQVKRNPDGTVELPKKIDQTVLAKAAQQILQSVSMNKSEVTLSADKPSSDEVIFHNGAQGSVRVVLDPVAQLPGFSAVLDKADLNANENAVLKLRYEPPDTDSRPQPATVRLKVEPFNQQFAITVKFAPSVKPPADR